MVFVLGSPYIYDKRAIFHHHENKFHLFKNGIEYIVRAHNKKLNASLVNVGQMKRIVNASQNFALFMIKRGGVEESKTFQEYESSFKSNLNLISLRFLIHVIVCFRCLTCYLQKEENKMK